MKTRSIADGFEDVCVIDKYEYVDFDHLQNITIGKNIVGFGIQTFRYCRDLRWIQVDEDNPFFSSVDGVLFDKSQTVLICYPASHVGYQYTVSKTVKKIEDFAFSGARNLRKIKLNEGLVEIGDCGFEGCNGLTEMEFPETVQGLGHVAMQGCGSIRTIHIPAELQYIDFPALPDELESITVDFDNPAFTVVDNVLYSKDMSTLIRVPARYDIDEFAVLPSVVKIESAAFERCHNLQKISIPDTVKSIGDFAFAFLEDNLVVTLPAHLYREEFGILSSRRKRFSSLSEAVFQTTQVE